MIVGAQWGDEGKGKIVDLLAQESDIVCRYQGGPNAGHTIIADGETFKIRQIPSGVIAGRILRFFSAAMRYKGMLPCFFGGFVCRLLPSISSARISFGLRSCGKITSST